QRADQVTDVVTPDMVSPRSMESSHRRERGRQYRRFLIGDREPAQDRIDQRAVLLPAEVECIVSHRGNKLVESLSIAEDAPGEHKVITEEDTAALNEFVASSGDGDSVRSTEQVAVLFPLHRVT